MKKLLSSLFLVILKGALYAQELSEEEAKKANNPLADVNAVSFQNYYVPTIYEDANLRANTLMLRYAKPLMDGKLLTRITVPLGTVPAGYDGDMPTYSSGLGDVNFFATYTFSKPGAKTLLAVGPQVVIPTASNDFLGTGKWQLGGALAMFNAGSAALQWGSLITYQTSVGGDEDRTETSLLIIQPILFFQLGKGAYLRSSALWNFNLEAEAYNLPIGIGAGHAVKVNKTVFNIFLEPQFTILHEGFGQPALQLFGGINSQF